MNRENSLFVYEMFIKHLYSIHQLRAGVWYLIIARSK